MLCTLLSRSLPQLIKLPTGGATKNAAISLDSYVLTLNLLNSMRDMGQKQTQLLLSSHPSAHHNQIQRFLSSAQRTLSDGLTAKQ